jgi:predicted SAM-dependent methyltransferase
MAINLLGKIFRLDINEPVSIFFQMLFANKRKFNIGSGKFTFENGWLNTDKNSLNICREEDWKRYLKFLKLDNILAEHVWEHLAEEETAAANRNCFAFLKHGGNLRLAVPDGFHPKQDYIDWVKIGGVGPGADDHKVLYNYRTLKASLEKAGFKVTLLEYWDEEGQFHFTNWTDEAGRIIRSRRYDKRNAGSDLNYTSLIIDAKKP